MPTSAESARASYSERAGLLAELAGTLSAKVTEALDGVPHVDRIAFRPKDIESFVKKAQDPKYVSPLTQIEDQIGGRVITFFLDDIPRVRERLEQLFGAVEHVSKEPAGATEFGYVSDHFVFVVAEHHKPDGWNVLVDMPRTFEMQVRTLFMHAWAEPQHDLGYKPQGVDVDDATRRELAWVAASSWGADQMMNRVAQRVESTKS